LSGTQVAMVAALLDWALRRRRATPIASALVVSLALTFYCAFVGGDVPVLRATVMAIVIVTGRALDLDGDAADLLGLAALNLLAVPLSGAVLLAGFGVVLVSALPPFLLPAAVGRAWLAARALLLTGEVVRLLPWLDVRVATPSLGPALVGLAGLFAFARGR